MSRLKYSHDFFFFLESLEHSLEAKQRGWGHGGRAYGWGSERLHRNAQELKLLIPPPVL